MKQQKILFIQLPLLDHGYNYIGGNSENAPQTIAGYILNKYPAEFSIDLLPYILTNFLSDAMILKYIHNMQYDILCFSNYLWNIERHHDIAKAVKELNPEIKILFGGPEIQLQSYILQQLCDAIDYFIIGEGEWFFDCYTSNTLEQFTSVINANNVIQQPSNQLIAADTIYEPYSQKRLSNGLDKSIYYELTRGCPFKCAYCNYSKNVSKVRETSFDKLLTVIEHAPKSLQEIYILSPTFNTHSQFEQRLHSLAAVNKNYISLHTELRTDSITPAIARLIKKAGFNSLEVGLQTYTKASLKIINRNTIPEKELTGMLALKNAGIDLKIGIIPGLPGDTPANFIKTIDLLFKNKLGDCIELYPLMVLPGTDIFDLATEYKFEFQDKPPYYLVSSDSFTFNDFKQIITYIEQNTEYSHDTFSVPDLTDSKDGLYNRTVAINLRDKNISIETIIQNLQCNVSNIVLTGKINDAFYALIDELLTQLPKNLLLNIIIKTESLLDEQKIADILSVIVTNSFHSRLHIFNNMTSGLAVKFFQITSEPAQIDQLYNYYSLITPVLQLTSENSKALYNLKDTIIQIPANQYFDVKDILINEFQDNPELLLFTSREQQFDYFNSIDLDYVDFPFSFSCTSL